MSHQYNQNLHNNYVYRNLIYLHAYKISDLIRLTSEHPVIKVNISKLNLSFQCFFDGEIYYSILDVLDDPGRFKEDYNKTMKTDLNNPIIIRGNEIIYGKYEVLKALIKNVKQLNAKEVTENELKKIVKWLE